VIDTTTSRSNASVIAYLAFLGVLLATGIDIALPAYEEIAEGLDTDADMSLVITTYLVGMALGQLVVGPMADRFGRKPAVLGGLAFYVVGAIASAVAPSFGLLLGARVLWGLGAAAPAGLRSAITRDLYSGDEMARITTIMMAVFLLGPVFVPLLGDAMIEAAPWQIIFWFAAALAVIGALWCVRFGETLAEENRAPLELAQFRRSISVVARTRVTLGNLLASTFLSGAFFIFLGSSPAVFDKVYDRSDQFAILFAAIGIFTIPPLLVNNKLIARFGARRMSLLAAGASTTLAVAAIVPTMAADGRPGFWVWFVWLMLVSSLTTLATPSMTAMALEPMGELAGAASSLLFFSTFAFGAGLAAIFNAMVDTTVTPFVVGFALYAAIAFCFLVWAGDGSADAIAPSTRS